MVIHDRVLMVRYIKSESDVTHTPVSSIKPEEITRCNITGLSCSEAGVVYAVDQGSKKIYRVEVETGNCYSFGQNYLANPKDVEIWQDFLLVLDSTNLFLLTPMGIFVKKFPLTISDPKTVNVLKGNILVSGIAGDLHLFQINTN
eukprot:GFUD01127695.1.p1 GENE.GFUD01127695.1~~GFUD01127695.1.p1  ORF type:complete len:145 (+),score=26.26 GFUD01127695.1:422-856(+)